MPVTNYIWDEVNDTILMETDGSGNPTAVYTNEPGQFGGLVSEQQGNQSQYYHFDGIGSTRQLTSSTGQVTDRFFYDAFGNTIQSTGRSVVPYHFVGRAGYYHDPELAAFYVRARYFNPQLGRWSALDLLGYRDAANLYDYVHNRPTGSLDPTGTITVRSETNLPAACGKFTYATFTAILSQGALESGYLVQRVDVRCNIRKCCKCPDLNVRPLTPTYSFYEAIPAVAHSGGNFRDTADFTPRLHTCGFLDTNAVIKFFYASKLPANPLKGWKKGVRHGLEFPRECQVESGSTFLPTDKKELPWFEDPRGTRQDPYEPPVFDALYLSWNCCQVPLFASGTVSPPQTND